MSFPRRGVYRVSGDAQLNESSGWSISTILGIVFIISLVSPLVSWIGRGLVFSWGVFALWLLTVSFRRRLFWRRVFQEASKRRGELVMLGVWFLVVFFNVFVGRGYTGTRHLMIMLTLLMIVLMEMVYTEILEGAREIILTAIVLWLGLETLRSVPVLWSEPLLPRVIMAAGAESSLYERAVLSSVGEYGFYTACAIGIPVMFAVALDKGGPPRIVLLLSCVMVGIAIALASFLGATLLMVTGFLVLGALAAVSSGQHKLRSLSLFLVVAIISAMVWYAVLGDTMAGEAVAEKLVRQSEGILELGLIEGDQTNRANLWKMSVDTFLQYPIFGIGPSTGTANPYMGYRVGGHSSWLDIAAEYGVLGLVFYLGFLFAVIKRAVVFRKLDRSWLVGLARIVSCGLFFVGGSYNPVVFTIQVNALFFFFVVVGARSVSRVKTPSHSRLFRRSSHSLSTPEESLWRS